jgi:hypothetical protein
MEIHGRSLRESSTADKADNEASHLGKSAFIFGIKGGFVLPIFLYNGKEEAGQTSCYHK